MVTTNYPGVYVEEVSSGVRPIEGVSTSTAAFVGETEKGPLDRALMVSRYSDFEAEYGKPLKARWLSYAVQQFFDNGGTRLYIARVAPQKEIVPNDADYQKAFALLDAVPDINIIAAPGRGSLAMVNFGADYCERRGDCIFIGDMDLSVDTPAKAEHFVGGLHTSSSHAAVYFPWLRLKSPTRTSLAPLFVPPSGGVAGLYARTDATRGVWKAPAGTQATIKGAIALTATVSDQEQSLLNPFGVNVIREMPGSGIVVWGSRTLATQTQADFRYVSVRRMAIYLKESIDKWIQWAVFEPNDANLWQQLRLNIGYFMAAQFREGAFAGQKADEAYFVKCDQETTTQADIEHGIVNVQVGFAPLKPAEFIVLSFTQRAGQV